MPLLHGQSDLFEVVLQFDRTRCYWFIVFGNSSHTQDRLSIQQDGIRTLRSGGNDCDRPGRYDQCIAFEHHFSV